MLISKTFGIFTALALATSTIASCTATAPRASAPTPKPYDAMVVQMGSTSGLQTSIPFTLSPTATFPQGEKPQTSTQKPINPKPTTPQPSTPQAPSTNKATAVKFAKSTDLKMSVGQSNLRTATTTPPGLPVTYSSSAPKVAKVAANGNVTCLAQGTTTITATCGNKTASYQVTVPGTKQATVPGTKQATDFSTQQATDFSEYAAEVFRLVNVERKNAGLNEVYWEDDFFTCAQVRADEMAEAGIMSHTRPNPVKNPQRDFPQNVSGGGVYNAPSVADELGVPYDWVMENVAVGYGTPEQVMRAWMNSSGHRSNILRSSHTRCGVGVARSDNGTYWALWLDSTPAGSGNTTGNRGDSGTVISNHASYSLNETTLNLDAGDGFQLSVEASDPDIDFEVKWVGSSIGGDVLSIDDDGYITTYYREGMTSAKATLSVSAKVYVSDKLVQTLQCKVVVVQ